MSGWGAVIQAGAELGSAFLNQRFAESLQHQSQDFNAQQYANRYQVQVADMKKAGLNPMLAYGASPGSGPSVGTAAPARAQLSPLQAYNETRIASATEAKLRQDAATSKSQEDLNDSQYLANLEIPSLLRSQAVAHTASADQSRAAAEKIRAEIGQVAKQIEVLETQKQKNRSDISVNNSIIALNKKMEDLRKVEAFLVSTEQQLKDLQVQIEHPKAMAARTPSAFQGHVADNVSKLWKVINPFSSMFSK